MLTVHQMLEKYEAKAKKMTDAELKYAFNDVKEAIKANQHDQNGEYMARLMCEYDAYSVEGYRRVKVSEAWGTGESFKLLQEWIS